jgi:restriction endonuclease S subunit
VPDSIAEGFVSAECLVLVPRVGRQDGRLVMLPELLALLLRSDFIYGQVVHLVIGTGRPRLSRSTVLNIRLPCPSLAEQRRLLEVYRKSEREARALLRESERVAAQARQVGTEASRRLVHDILVAPGREAVRAGS